MTPTRIPDAVRAHVRERDNGCLSQRIGMAGPCAGQIEQDHIENGGMGLKGESVPLNLASLCSSHHDQKTRLANYWRPILLSKVAELEARVQEGFWPA